MVSGNTTVIVLEGFLFDERSSIHYTKLGMLCVSCARETEAHLRAYSVPTPYLLPYFDNVISYGLKLK